MSIGRPKVGGMLIVAMLLLGFTSTADYICSYSLSTMYGMTGTESDDYLPTFYTSTGSSYLQMVLNGYNYTTRGAYSYQESTTYAADSEPTGYLYDLSSGTLEIAMDYPSLMSIFLVNQTTDSIAFNISINAGDKTDTSPVDIVGCTGTDDGTYTNGTDFSSVNTIHVSLSSVGVLTLTDGTDTLYTKTVGTSTHCPEVESGLYLKFYSYNATLTPTFYTTSGAEPWGTLTMASWDIFQTYDFRSADNVETFFSDTSDSNYTVETYFLTVNESDCTDTTDSEWSTPTAGTNYCGTDLSSRPECKLPSGSTSALVCETSGQCCWDSDNDRCVASSKYVCDISDLSDALLNANNYAIYKDGTKQTDDNWSATVFPGEQITIKCTKTATPWFSGTASVDSNTETAMTCLLTQDGNDIKISDLATQYNNIACDEKCTTFNYNSSIQSISPAIGDGQRLNTKITVTCNSGYAKSTGVSSWDVDCNNAAGDVDMCYGCAAPTNNSDLTDGGTFSDDRVEVVSFLTYTCKTGYSAEGGEKTQSIGCFMNTDGDQSVLSADFDPCKADCPLSIDNSITDVTLANGVQITDKYLPFGSSATISCDDGTALALGQSETISCNTEGTTITISACDNYCNVTTLLTNNAYSIQISDSQSGTYTSSTSDHHVYGTWMTLACDTGKETSYEDQSKLVLQCNNTNYNFTTESFNTNVIPTCYDTCTLRTSNALNIGDVSWLVGDPRTLTNNMAIRTGEKVKLFCNDTSLYTVKGSSVSYETYECNTEGDSISVQPCFKFCSISDLTMNTNTNTEPTGKAGYGQTVTFSCSADYYLGSDSGDKYSTTSGDKIRCKWVDNDVQVDVVFSETTVPTTSQCYAGLKMVSSVPDGDGAFKVTITMPSDRDTSENITSITLYTSSGISLGTASLTSQTSSTSFTVSYTDTSDYSTMTDAYATIVYSDNPTYNSSTLSLVKGPPSADVSVTSSGVGSVTVTISNEAALSSYVSTTSLSISLSATATKDSKKRATDTSTVSGISYVSGTDTYSLDFSGLSSLSTYSVDLTVDVTVDGTSYGGGSTTFDIDTGFPTPSVTTSVTSSTSNTFTITMGDSLTLTGDYNTTIDGSTYELTYTDGVATKLLTGLTALASYTYDVTMTSASDVVSDSVSVTFTQGPTEPNVTGSTVTDTSFNIVWIHTSQNAYSLILYKKLDTGDYSEVGSHSISATETINTHTFTDLDAGETYKIIIDAEMEVNGVNIKSDTTDVEKVLYSCTRDQKSAYTLYYKNGGQPVTADYFYADASVMYIVECPANQSFKTVDSTFDNETSCIGAESWSLHSDCQDEADASTAGSGSAGAMTGIIIAIIILLLLLVLLIVFIDRRRKGNPNSNAYSPRDEERNQEVEGGEAWKNPYYHEDDNKKQPEDVPLPMPEYNTPKPPPPVEYNEPADLPPPAPEEDPVEYESELAVKSSPDIPAVPTDNREAPETPPPAGDNVSQGGEMTFDDEEPEANTVLENRSAGNNV